MPVDPLPVYTTTKQQQQGGGVPAGPVLALGGPGSAFVGGGGGGGGQSTTANYTITVIGTDTATANNTTGSLVSANTTLAFTLTVQ